MITKPIQQLDDVILEEMQKSNRNSLTFREIRMICSIVIPLLPVYNNEEVSGKRFMHELLDNIQNLENNGIAKIARNGKFIVRIYLTERGKEMLQQTIFTGGY